jgi:hypothetical protein
MLKVLKKFSSTESRLRSGRGEMHVKRVDGVARLTGGMGNGDVHGEVSDDDVGINFVPALSDIFLKLPSLLFFASQCSMIV